MKKFSKKRKNNKGFSLVELIVVVAIMAVLMAVLVPTLVRNVEKTRVQKDKSAISEIREAVVLALADEEYLDATPSTAGATATGSKIVIASLFGTDTASTKLADEVEATVGGDAVTLTSKMKTDCKVVIKSLDATTGKVVFQIDSTKAGQNFYIDESGEHSGTYGGTVAPTT
ncbi:MAG: type II secretion system protein [Butyrivibrio sp.]